MLQVQHLRKDYGATTIFSEVTFRIQAGEHVGLIGANGTGKSTLLRCIVGQERPDSGSITLARPDLRIGYLPQTLDQHLRATVGTTVAVAQAELVAATAALQSATDALATTHNMTTALADYEQALAHFEALGGYEREQRAAAVLTGLGLGQVDPATPVSTLSGGQKTRLGLALLLLHEPDVLLLDEPTNHLDQQALEWLEEFVQSYPHAALIVSHDRTFLDRTVSRILYLDHTTRTMSYYSGNYSAFVAARTHEQERQALLWKRQQEQVRRMERDIAQIKGQALRGERQRSTSNPDSKFALDQRSAARKLARQAQSRQHKLERFMTDDERVERPCHEWELRLDFAPPPPGGRAVLSLEQVDFAYPGQPPLFRALTFEVQHGERVALVGANGTGKTTLLRLMTGQLQPQAGRVRLGANIQVGMLTQEQENLDPVRTVLETTRQACALSESEARTFLHRFLFTGDNVWHPVSVCSPGERSRLQLALLVLRGCNLLLLDEPLNHLDIAGREHFTAALDAFSGTIIVVSHDRAFRQAFARRVIEVGGVFALAR